MSAPKKDALVLDMTPSWQGLLQSLLLVQATATTKEARGIAMEELRRMAQIADLAVPLTKKSVKLLAACKAQHQAIDILFAMLIQRDPKFFPSKSGKPWSALKAGNVAIKFAEAK